MAILSVLYKYSDLQITFGVNMVAIAEGRPVQMGVKAMLTYYIEHQKRVVTRRTKYELEQAQAREHILAGLMVAVNHLDEVIALIRKKQKPQGSQGAADCAVRSDGYSGAGDSGYAPSAPYRAGNRGASQGIRRDSQKPSRGLKAF